MLISTVTGNPKLPSCHLYRHCWHWRLSLWQHPMPAAKTNGQDDVIKWKYFRVTSHLWEWPVKSPHKGMWRGALKFSLLCDWTNVWVNNPDASDFRRHRAHYDVTVMGVIPVSVYIPGYARYRIRPVQYTLFGCWKCSGFRWYAIHSAWIQLAHASLQLNFAIASDIIPNKMGKSTIRKHNNTQQITKYLACAVQNYWNNP